MAKKTSEKKAVSRKPQASARAGAPRAGAGTQKKAGRATSAKAVKAGRATGVAGKGESKVKVKASSVAKGKAAPSGKPAGKQPGAAKAKPTAAVKKRGAVMSLRPKKKDIAAVAAASVEQTQAPLTKEQRQAEKLAAKTAEKAAAKAVRKAEQADKLESINTKIGEQQARARRFAIDAARIMDDLHCENVVVLDLTKKAATSDYVVLGTGTSDRQMRTCGEQVRDLAREQGHGETRMEADDRSTWIVAAAPEVVAHIFEPNTRAHYDLETMWGDVPRVDWKRESR